MKVGPGKERKTRASAKGICLPMKLMGAASRPGAPPPGRATGPAALNSNADIRLVQCGMNGHRGTHGTLSGRLSIERKKGVIEGPNGLHSHRWRVQAQSGACLRGRATEGKNVGRWRVLRLQRWAQKTPSTGVRAGPGQHLPTKENKKHFSERAYLVSSSQNGSFGVKIWIGRAKRGRSGERAPAARPHNKNGSGCGKAGAATWPTSQ